MLNYGNLGEKLYDFENENFGNLYTITISNWNVWRIIKSNTFYEFINQSIQTENFVKRNDTFTKRKRIKILLKGIYDFIRFFPRFCFVLIKKYKKRPTIIITLSANKTYKDDNGRYFDIIVDCFIKENLINNYLYIEVPDNAGRHKLKSFVKSDFIIDDFSIVLRLLYKIISLSKYSLNHGKIITELLNSFFKPYNLQLQNTFVQNNLYTFYSEYIFYRALFKIFRPKCVITNDMLATGKMAAAKRLNIKVIELQHGLMEEYYPQYQLHPKFLSIKNQLPIPDQIGVFGKFHKQQLVSKGFWSDSEIVILGRFDPKGGNDGIINKVSDKITLTFVTQNFILFEQTRDFLQSFIKLIDSRFLLILKIHPLETTASKEWYIDFVNRNDNIKIIQTEYHVTQLLKVTDILIGFNSTVLLEAVQNTVFSISISDKNLKNGIHSLLGNDQLLTNLIYVCHDAVSCMELINQYFFNKELMSKWKTMAKKTQNYLFAPEYLDNCQKMLANISISKN